MRWLEHGNEQGVQELHRGCRLVTRVVVEANDLFLVTVFDPNCHLQIAKKVSELFLFSRRARQVHGMLKTVSNAAIYGDTVTLIVALMQVWLSFDAPTLRLSTPGIERGLIHPNNGTLIGNEVSNQSSKLNTLCVNRFMVCDGFPIDSRCGPVLDLGAQVEVPEASH